MRKNHAPQLMYIKTVENEKTQSTEATWARWKKTHSMPFSNDAKTSRANEVVSDVFKLIPSEKNCSHYDSK